VCVCVCVCVIDRKTSTAIVTLGRQATRAVSSTDLTRRTQTVQPSSASLSRSSWKSTHAFSSDEYLQWIDWIGRWGTDVRELDRGATMGFLSALWQKKRWSQRVITDCDPLSSIHCLGCCWAGVWPVKIPRFTEKRVVEMERWYVFSD